MLFVYLMIACVIVDAWGIYACFVTGRYGAAVFNLVTVCVCLLAAWLNYMRAKARG